MKTDFACRPPRYPWGMTLRLYDTAARATREFVPVTPGKVSIYLCGATVQAPPHIGHIRSGVSFDIARRWLEYRGYAVTFVRNVTDIDDKIIRKAAEQGVETWRVAQANEYAFQHAYRLLGCEDPSVEPRATGHIPEMVAMMRQAHRRRPRLRGRRRRLLPRALPSRVRRAGPLQRGRPGRAAGRRRRADHAQGGPARLRAVEGVEAGRALLGHAVGSGPPGLAPGVLRDGAPLSGHELRHPRRRRRPDLPAPRERAGAVARVRRQVHQLLDAQRLGHPQEREDVQVAGQLGAGHRTGQAVPAGGPALLPRHPALPLDDRVHRGLAARGRRRVLPHRGLRHPGAGDGRPDRGRRPRCRRRSRSRWTTTSACRARWPCSTPPSARATPPWRTATRKASRRTWPRC